jgi:hypothetical protein
LNQRGGAIDIDNTTEQEKVKISQRSGSNIALTNLVNSELATNNKQVTVVRDSFETVGGDKQEFIVKNHTIRTGGTSYELKGFIDQSQLDAYTAWKKTFYDNIAKLNGQFKIFRGGTSYPNGTSTLSIGDRATNPVVGSIVYNVQNVFHGYKGTPVRTFSNDDVSTYITVPDHGNTKAGEGKPLTEDDIAQAAGAAGSQAPGVMEFGPDKSAATERGTWSTNQPALNVNNILLKIQDPKNDENLNIIEQKMGDGGDEILFVKRHKVEQVGAIFNDYPSVRIDEKGRSQPFEVIVSKTGSLKNHDYVPLVEEIDNSSIFPAGNDDSVVGNRFSRTVGSGGISLKTTGALELGGMTLKGGFKRVNINASHGIQIGSEAFVEIMSLKTIMLRTNRQVYIEGGLGVTGNAVIAGGAYVEGELYCHHITAPLEVHQTEDTVVAGQFATASPRTLIIGECQIGGAWFPVYALPTPDLIVNYPHSHHHNGIPIRLTQSNEDVRNFAANEGINSHDSQSMSLPQNHEHKLAMPSS